MTSKTGDPGASAADAAVEVSDHSVELLAKAFRAFERHYFTLKTPDGTSMRFDRDLVRAGAVVGVLPVDLARREVVLIRQFRLAAHVATGLGEIVEIPAGRCDPGESARAAALRECHEEIGVAAKRAARLMTVLAAAAFSDELMSLWVAEVDAAGVPALAGEEEEGEFIRPLRLPVAEAVKLVAGGKVHSAQLIIALQWLAANETRLDEVLRDGDASSRGTE